MSISDKETFIIEMGIWNEFHKKSYNKINPKSYTIQYTHDQF